STLNAQEYSRLVTTYPNVGECVALPTDGTFRLWNRMPTHPDFLNVRLGLGSVPLPSTIQTQKQKLSIINDPLRDESERLQKTYSTIQDAPVLTALRGESVVGILGREEATLFAQGLLMQIAALHSYHDVRIAVFTEENTASQWAWARWLPHVFASEDRQMRMVVSKPSAVHDVMNSLNDVINMRRSTQEDNASSKDSDEEKAVQLPLPHYIIFCTDSRLLENEPPMRQLLTNQVGMTLIMLAPSMELLPKECRKILNVAARPGLLHTSDGETTQVDFEYPNRNLLLSFARQIAPLRVRDAAENAAIPTLVSFLDIYGVRRTSDLDVWRMWTENHTYNGLRSTIGYAAGSQPFVLDISDKYHGPHGLIAGTTGSGKSVMLQTYILSLALNYSPAEIQFILIDYKGGGMADAFRGLPHVAGIIDNLQGELIISRALASLNGEIHRREHIFKEHGVDKIDEYNRVFGSDPSEPTLPHLIIIVDEFAELKSEQPEFMTELVSASRVGRSLGVHLILATQKPSNSVSDEIWANSRFHLCLRVQTRSDSMEMLKRPDAAFIKGMGRCFIQIGNDELFEQVQTSYSGLAYNPNEPRAEEMPHLLGDSGQAVRTPKPKKAKSRNPKEKEYTQMDAVLDRISEIASQHSLDHQRQLWLPPMPSQLYFSQLALYRDTVVRGDRYANAPEHISFLAGLADDVAQQRYLPYIVDMTQVRNLMIVGLAGTGKTTAVQSIVTSLCGQYDPDHLNMYIMSLTSKTLNSLTAFPQVGDIVFENDIIEIKRLINMLFEEEERRSEMFAELSTDSFIEYNRACRSKGRPTVPAIVVFVDRFEQLKNIFANDDYYTGRIHALLREGSGRGIHFIVTALGKNEIPAKLHPFFSGIALQLRERGDYSDVIGARLPFDMAPIASMPGRGMGVIVEGDKAVPYEIHFALGGYEAPEPESEDFADLSDPIAYSLNRQLNPIEGLADGDRNERIAAFSARLKEQWTGKLPPLIPRIPENPDYPQFSQAQGFEAMQKTPYQLPVGYDMTKGSLASFDLEKNYSMLVTGPKKSGRTNFLKLTARLFAERGADIFVYGDPGWKKLCDELGARLLTTEEELADFISWFVAEYPGKRKRLHDEAMAQGRAQARRQALEFKPCVVLLDNAERICSGFTAPRYAKSADQIIADYEADVKAAQEAGKPAPNAPSDDILALAKHPFRHNIPTKKFIVDLLSQMCGTAELYNIFIFMSLSGANRLLEREEPFKSLIAQGRGVALGGRVSEFDPLGLAQNLTPQSRGQALPAGSGYLVTNAGVTSIRVPLVDSEEDEE
ncbi:MAG: type VII secretion protein EssC, partial [Clostridia bacterium]|nr:type VII secretion protein EssC [Clostridia bacterium]